MVPGMDSNVVVTLNAQGTVQQSSLSVLSVLGRAVGFHAELSRFFHREVSHL
jgi:hypothetical protein